VSNSRHCAGTAKSRGAEILGLRAKVALPILIAAASGAGANAASDSLDEVVITARKVAEPLADVPLSIQVITREELQRAGIDGLQTLAGYVPGLYVEPMWGGTNAAPTLRGQSHPGPGGNTVGVFVDGVLQANVSGDDAAMFDLERIEVVKGPQSALYGDSTFAGAINLVTRRPTTELQSEATLSAGSDAYRAIFASVSGPLGPPRLLGRASFADREFGGTGVNLADPRENLNGYQKWGASLALEYTWASGWRVSGDARLADDRSGQPAASTLFASAYNCGSRDPTTGYWSFYCGDIPRTRRYDLTPDIPDSVTRTFQTSARVEWRAERYSFDSFSAYYRSNSHVYQDFDGTSAGELMGICTLGVNCDVPGAAVNRLVKLNQVGLTTDLIEQTTQEFRVRHQGERVDWMLGAQVVKNSEHSGDGLAVGPVALAANEELTALLPQTPYLVGPISTFNGLVLADPNRVQDFEFIDVRSTLTTVFGAFDYRPTPRVDLHAELRQGFGQFSVSAPRVSIDYRTDAAGLVWLSVARGETAGGSNGVPTLIPSELNFGPEFEWTYELGFRGPLWSERVNLSATAFYNDWRNAQIPGPSNTPGYDNSVIRNVRGIATPGAEFTANIKIARNLSAGLGYTYDDPRFKSGSEDYGGSRFCGVTAGNTTSNFCTLGPSRVLTPGSGFLVPYVDGNALQRAPQQQWTAVLTLEPPHSLEALHWFARISAEHQGRVFVRPIDGAYDGEHTLLDARFGLARSPWSVELWGGNLTDENYIRAVASRPRFYFPTMVQPQDLIYGDGRRFGLDLRLSF
jgi:iron complex outermembrane recepter protein